MSRVSNVVVQIGHRVDRDAETELPHEAVGGPWLKPDLRRVAPVIQAADEADRWIEVLLHFGGFELGDPAVVRIIDDGAERRIAAGYARAAGVQEPSDHLEILRAAELRCRERKIDARRVSRLRRSPHVDLAVYTAPT